MANKFYIVTQTPEYTLTRLKAQSFVDEIIIKTNENILKNYLYVDKRRIIA